MPVQCLNHVEMLPLAIQITHYRMAIFAIVNKVIRVIIANMIVEPVRKILAGKTSLYRETQIIDLIFRHNGTCIPMNSVVTSNNGWNFTCECIEGYNGRYCELAADLCVNITCKNRGICTTVDQAWKCYCLDSSLYYGDYCQYKTMKLQIREILSKSFASVAIGAIVTTCGFVILMDILKYAFNIDPVMGERESYRKRCEDLKRARQPVRQHGPKFALRFKYVS